MKRLAALLFFAAIYFIVCTSLYAQTNPDALKYSREGYELEQQGKFSEALYRYNQSIAADPKYPYPVQRIAAMYQRLRNFPKAIQFYHRAILLDSTFDDYNYLNLALSYRSMNNTDSSMMEYRLFLKKLKPIIAEDSVAARDASRYIHYVEQSAELRKSPKNTDEPHTVPGINSPYNEFGASVTADGKLLIFTSRRPSTNQRKYTETSDYGDDIFYSLKDSLGNWSEPNAVAPPINTTDDEGAATITADGQTVFFSLCRRPEGAGDCDIYMSHLEGLSWSKPQNLGRPFNAREWDAQPSVSADGSTIYFSSRRFGSVEGSEDIWVVYKNPDGTWGLPLNLGETINTNGSERSPFIAADNRTLYFSSNGHPGYGNHDLFMTRKQDDGSWSLPVNLGSPINTEGDDEFLTIPAKGDKIYYSSQRSGNNTDIYEAILPMNLRPAPVTLIVGKVFDKRTKKPLGAKIELTNLAKDELLSVYNANSATGEFFITLPVGIEYGVTATATGYVFFSDHYTPPDTAKYRELTYNIYLTPVDTSPITSIDTTIIPLNNIFFDFNKATLRAESTTELKNIVRFLKENSSIKIQISGHTDSIGSDAVNKALSQTRAEAVRQYLLSHGINTARVSAKGYGDTKPVAPNDTEENRQKNRRTEFIIFRK